LEQGSKALKSFAFIQAEEKSRGKGKRKLYKRKRERRVKKKSLYINSGCFLGKRDNLSCENF
jgi:hypothetical protein